MDKRIGLTVVDENSLPLETAEHLAPKRRRGRPAGAKAKTNQSPITADDFAFLRAVVEGIEPKAAARQYLAHIGGAMERRGALDYPQELRKRICAAAQGVPELLQYVAILWPTPEGDADVAPDQETVPGQAPSSAEIPAPAPPSLEEFAQRFPEDMYSVQELMELYEEELQTLAAGTTQDAGAGLSPATAHEAVAPGGTLPAAVTSKEQLARKINALNMLDRRLSVRPARDHSVELWLPFTEKQMQGFRLQGVITLGNLIDWIALTGARWYERIPLLGRTRAKRVVEWLQGSAVAPAAGLPTLPMVPSLSQRPQGGLAPLEEMVWPISLDGSQGVFRAAGINGYEALNDRQAMHQWFKNKLASKSGATLDAYRRAAERLALWSITERRKPISSLNSSDLLAFFHFLKNPPAHWVQQRLRIKSAPDWRPLRGPLNDKAIDQTSAALRSMFTAWEDVGYLKQNPLKGVAQPKRKDIKLDVMRSFSEQDKEVIAITMQQLPEGPSKRRLVAIFRLLGTAGLRRAELAEATWSKLERYRVDGSVTDSWALKFVGKGQRERIVPIQEATMEALRAHLEDRQQMIAQPDSMYSNIEPGDMPLIGVIDERLARSSEGSEGYMPHNAQRAGNTKGGLSSGRIYGLLKAFFKKCAANSADENSDFLAASTHWLRHTFAHSAFLESGKDLLEVQQLLGHADINTTALYAKADLSARARTVNKIKPFV